MKTPALSSWKTIVLVLSVAMVWNYWPVLRGKVPFPTVFIFQFPVFAPTAPADLERRVPNIGDVSTAFFPYRIMASRSWADGFPLWDPYLQSGKPFLANPQSALFYPGNSFFYVLPVSIAWCIAFLLRPLLAGLFTALFLKRIGASTTGALVSALVFAFSGFMTVWQGQAMLDAALWLPLICYSVVRLHEERSNLALVLTAIAFSMPVLAGHPETAAHLTAVGVAFAVFMAFLRPSSSLSWSPMKYLTLFGAGGILAIGLAAVQIVPTTEWLPHLNRGLDLVWPPAPLWSMLGFVSRDILSASNSFGLQIPEHAAYLGMIAFVAFPVAWLHARKRYVVFFSLSTAASLCIAYGIGPLFTLSQRLPMFHSLKNHRLILIVTFGVAVLAGLGVSAIEGLRKEERSRRIRAAAFASVGVCLAALMIYLVQVSLLMAPVGHSRYPKASLLFLAFATTGVMLRVIGALPGKSFGVVLIGFLIADVCAFSYGFIPFDKPENLLPKNEFFARLAPKTPEPERVIEIGGPYAANTELLYRVQTSGGYEIPLARMSKFLTGVARNEMDAVMLDSQGALNVSDRRLDMLSTKYYAVYNGDPFYSKFRERPDRFRFVFEYGNTSLFESLTAMPAALVVPASGIIVVSDEERQMQLIRSPGFNPRRNVILGESQPLASAETSSGSVSWVSRRNTTFQLKVDSPEDSVLVVSQTFFPGWKAYVDGKETRVFPANYALTGIAIGSGSHDVVFSFEPYSFRIGLLISGTACAVLCVLIWRQKRAKSRS